MKANWILKNLLTQGNRQAWEAFLALYSKIIFGVVSNFASDYDERMELFVFICEALTKNNFKKLRLFKSQGRKQKTKFATWLVLVAKNLCVDWYRKNNGRIRLIRAIDRLSQIDQRIFKLIYLDGNVYSHAFEVLHTDDHIQLKVSDFYRSISRIDKALTSKKYEKLAANLNRHRLKISVDDVEKFHAQSQKMELPNKVGERPDVEFQRKESLRELLQAINKLPAQDKLIIRLWFEQGLTAKEISAVMKYEKSDFIYLKIKRVLASLKRKLESLDFTFNDFENNIHENLFSNCE